MSKMTMAQTSLFSLHLLLFVIFLVSNINGLSLKMIPMDSPHLRLLPEHITIEERHQFLINISMSKVSNYPIRLTPNGLKSSIRFDGQSYYVTKLPLGTGQGTLSPFLLLDTSWHDTWVQCEGCYPCMESKEKNFHYKLSPTFTRMSVDDPLCNPRLDNEGSCGFDISNVLHSGVHSKMNLFFSKNERENIIVGIHGLAVGPRSFLTQSISHTNGRFSYCLAAGLGISNMYLGDEAQISGDATREVKTIAMNKLINYHVYLNAISVDGNRISIDPSIFELDPIGHTKGFFVDSGAPFTLLAESAYKPIRDAIAKYFRWNFGLRPKPSSSDLCYTDPIDVQQFPFVIFHFAGIGQQGEVDWIMDKNNLFKRTNQEYCLAMYSVPDPGPCLLGAYQQINFKVLFDVANGHLSFVPQVCHEANF